MAEAKPTPDIVVHHLNESRSERIFFALEELKLPYKVVVHFREPTMAAPREMREIHPLGKSPIITDHGKAIAESGAIIEYLIQTYSPTPPSYSLNNSYWSHFAEGSLMLFLQMSATFNASASQSPWFVRPVIGGFVGMVQKMYLGKEMNKMMKFMDDELTKSGKPYFSGTDEPSEADIMLTYPIRTLIQTDRLPGIVVGERTRQWYETISARPAYKRAVERIKEEETKARAEKDGKA